MRRALSGLIALAVLAIAPNAAAMEVSTGTEEDAVSLAPVSQIDEVSPDGVTSEASTEIAALDSLDGTSGATQEPLVTASAETIDPVQDVDAWVSEEVADRAEVTTEVAEAEVSEPITLEQFRVPAATIDQITKEWVDELLATYPEHTWAPMTFEPNDSQLDRMGLPSGDILRAQRYPEPTMIDKDGNTEVVELPSVTGEARAGSGSGSGSGTPTGTMGPTLVTVAGTGWFGIRPGAMVLLISGNSIGWCTLAHVYGSPGSYSISTAGHCGKTGDIATVVAGFGNQNGVLNPVLLDFGTFKSSTDGGLGNDKALIGVDSQWQNLVTPTMCFWGGPRGMYTKTGTVAGVTFPRRGLVPSVTLTPDPLLAQVMVHYGHGIGVGAGGTPRAATAIYWGTSHYMFEGVITFGDSGSGSNVIVGDTVGGSMEAAGINTHIWIDPLLRSGIGIMGGTRATQVSGTLANGQIVPYPAPVAGAP